MRHSGAVKLRKAPCGRRLTRQQELLHPPVQKLGDEQHVRFRTRHLVNPAELFQAFPRPPEHTCPKVWPRAPSSPASPSCRPSPRPSRHPLPSRRPLPSPSAWPGGRRRMARMAEKSASSSGKRANARPTAAPMSRHWRKAELLTDLYFQRPRQPLGLSFWGNDNEPDPNLPSRLD